jgi:hypothetical protein
MTIGQVLIVIGLCIIAYGFYRMVKITMGDE